MTAGQGKAPGSNNSIVDALRLFFMEAKRLPIQVTVIFLGTALAGIGSKYIGSRRFFRAEFFDSLRTDALYPLYEYLYWFASEVLWYFLLPILLIVVVLRKNPVDFGLRLGDVRFGLKVSAIFYAVMVPILWVVSDMSSFQEMYPHVLLVRDDWQLFMIYEAGLILYFIGWEYIWRGFMLFGLAPHTGGGVAILIQTIPFVILHYGKPMPETIGAIIAGIALGALALRTRSFWYCVLIHWSVMITIDVFCTVRHRAGISGIGIEAFSNFIGYLL